MELWSHKTILQIISLIFLASGGKANCEIIASPVDELFAHPVSSRGERTDHKWRSKSGDWGETLAEQQLRLRGFDEVVEVKHGGGQGIDRVAVKRDATGKIVDVKFVEVKTHRGGTPARVGRTKRSGEQLGRDWLVEKFRAMRSSSDPRTRNLAKEISDFRKTSGRAPNTLGELHDINTNTGRYTVRRPSTGAVLSDDGIKDHLRKIEGNVDRQETKIWARKSRRDYSKIRKTDMSDWTSGDTRFGTKRNTARLARESSSKMAKRTIARFAGPAGAMASLAMDASDLYFDLQAYNRGEISTELFVRNASGAVGGMAFAGAGAASGAYFGAMIGAFGGPIAFITVPAGTIIGGGIGAGFGYFAGSQIGTYGVDLWYDNLSGRVQSNLDSWLVETADLRFSEL